MTNILRPSLTILVLLTGLTGVVYPLAVTAVAQAVFPFQAGGSLIKKGDKVLGSELIGQPSADPRYFFSRASGTAPPYNGASSSGTNQGPLNPALVDAVKGRVEALRAADPGNAAKIPVDLVTASGSGLDPDISPAAAAYQIPRIARVRGIPEDRVRALVAAHTEGRTLGLLGEPRVNVLLLNLALDAMSAGTPGAVLVGRNMVVRGSAAEPPRR
jgi:K+-transporting ATPase ATPase C chain